MLEKPTVYKQNQPNSLSAGKKLIYLLAVVAGFGLLLAGLYTLYINYVSTHGVALLPDPLQTIVTDSPPSEKKPDQKLISSYKVPAEQPRSISINSVGVYGLVQRVGITKARAMATPSNVNFGGWYINSALPGKTGLSIINGHVSGKYSDGIFKKLNQVKTGDIIEIEMGDKSIRRFTVIDSKKMPEKLSAEYLFTKRGNIDSQLNLITCGGSFNKAKNGYDDRVVVVAKAVR